MFSVNAEPLGAIGPTEKGFIRQFLLTLPDSKKAVIKVFSKDAAKLQGEGAVKLHLRQDFFFAA